MIDSKMIVALLFVILAKMSEGSVDTVFVALGIVYMFLYVLDILISYRVIRDSHGE